MIKKLLSVVLFVSTVGVVDSFAQASNCTPDVTCVPTDSTFGICPDSATGIASGQIGVVYNQQMSIKIPATTTSQNQTFTLTHLGLTQVLVDTIATDVDSISAHFQNDSRFVDISVIGLTYLGSGSNTPSGGASGVPSYTMTKYAYWNANTNVCAVVSGTPTKVGTFHIRIKSWGRASIGGFGSWVPAPNNDDYRITIAPNGTMGIEALNMDKFEVMQNAPNPFNEKTVINYSSPNVSDVEFKVYNVIGAVVYTETVKADKGANAITLRANSFAPGAYMYSIKNGNQTITKRMVVTQ